MLTLIDRLQPAQRTVLRLQMIGLSYSEISDRTGRSYPWVNRQLSEGRRALRRLLEDTAA